MSHIASVQRQCQPLPMGYVKCNIDASFSSVHNRTWIGLCIGDETGLFIVAKTIWVQPVVPLNVGEAIRLLTTMKWIVQLGFNNALFAMDSKVVVDVFNPCS